jgi:uncharacterized protein (TIGR02421 family)
MGRHFIGRNKSVSSDSYRRFIRALSDRLVQAQRPIRILDTIKWDESIERDFFESGCSRLPSVTRDYYSHRPLPFDPENKREEFGLLERDIRRQLGHSDAVGQILLRICDEYCQVVDMLKHRGTRLFSEISRRLYTPRSADPAESTVEFCRILDRLVKQGPAFLEVHETTFDSRQTVELLRSRLTSYFGTEAVVRVRLSDGIVADAAAGSDYIKVRRDARFTLGEIRVLEVHEGWVHLSTSLCGQDQPVCAFLSKGPPSSTVTQEGLAVLTEILAGVAHPARLKRLRDRALGLSWACAGADFIDIYRRYVDRGAEPKQAYQQAMRLFRGSLPVRCGPFAKDICYSSGFLEVWKAIGRAASRGERVRMLLLFSGKAALEDVPTLAHLAEAGLIVPPVIVPPPLAELVTQSNDRACRGKVRHAHTPMPGLSAWSA